MAVTMSSTRNVTYLAASELGDLEDLWGVGGPWNERPCTDSREKLDGSVL